MGQRPQAEEPAPAPLPTRRPELDVMRAFVVAGLVVFHSAVVFASGSSWFINDPRPSPWFTVLLLWGSLWGMPLLFLVSGMGARYALRSRSAGAFIRERLARLLVPLLTGLVLLVAPMFYLNRLGEPGFQEPYWRFWLRFLNAAAIATGAPAPVATNSTPPISGSCFPCWSSRSCWRRRSPPCAGREAPAWSTAWPA
jgi:glucans biosynthesis protein C